MPDQLNSTDIFVGGLENIDGDVHASGSISAGDVVEMTANDNEVKTSDSDNIEGWGVALYGVSDGEAVAVAKNGAEVTVSFDTGDTDGANPGDTLTTNGSTGSAGTVKATDGAGQGVLGQAKTNVHSNSVVVALGQGGDVHS